MTNIKENGNAPVNARINIRYTENKPKITFSYPDKDSQVKGSMLQPVRYLCLILGMIMAIPFYYYGWITDIFPKLPPEDVFAGVFGFIGLIYYILPLIVYFPLKNKWNKLYPKWMGLSSKKKIKIFKPEDVLEKDGKIYCELPIFANIILDFKCKEEFSDYLNEIDIREYQFECFRMKTIRIKGKKIKKRPVNEFIWYARFYFDKKPEKGEMEVIFK